MAEDGTGIDEPGLLFSNVARVDLRPAEGGIDGDLDGFRIDLRLKMRVVQEKEEKQEEVSKMW